MIRPPATIRPRRGGHRDKLLRWRARGISRWGLSVTVETLDRDPHPVLATLRAREPVSWIAALDGWLVTRYDLALEVMRDAERFTVDDPRFSTARVIGPSMLSLDHGEHARHRTPFVTPFRARAVHERFDASTAEEARATASTRCGRPAAGSCGDRSRARLRRRSSRGRSGWRRARPRRCSVGTTRSRRRSPGSRPGRATPPRGRRRSPSSAGACSGSWTTTPDRGRCSPRPRRRPTSAMHRSSRTPPCCCSAGSRRPRG